MTQAPRPVGALVPYVLAACTAVSILSTDLITPSIPDLPQALGTDISAAQLTVSVNLLAYAIAQLIHGPLADAWGRKRLLIWAFTAFAAVSILSALAATIDTLLLGRFVQGLLSSVPSVVVVLIIRELYDPQRALKVMALYGAVLGIAPAVGPLIGGYLHVWFGWEAGFILIASLALVVTGFVWRLVPESLPEKRPLALRAALRSYRALLGNSAFLGRSLGVSALFAAYFTYVTNAPVVMIDLLGLANQRYGLTHVLLIAGYIAGNMVASRLAGRVEADVLVRVAALGMLLAMAALTAPIVLGTLSLPLILGPMVVYGVFLAFVLAAGPLVVLNAVPRDAAQGPAAAMLGSMQLGLSALAGYVCAQIYDGTAVPLAVVMSSCVVLGGAVTLLTVRPSVPGSDPAG